MWLREEEREDHMHILGTTGEGKSKLIEYLIRGDLERGHGVCFLDPTDRADTAYNILKWCCQQGFKKVCLIDPHTIHKFQTITAVQPFHYQNTFESAVVSNIDDTIKILFQTKDLSETPRIQRYLPALLRLLWKARLTLHEAVYFTQYKQFIAIRKAIISHSPPGDLSRLAVDEAFETFPRFNIEFASTVRRLDPFFDSTLDLMFGAVPGVDFQKMITEGWLVLVNLYPGLGFGPLHSRLLGTMVLNELIFSLDRLKNYGWRGTFYLYIDEAGRYANRNLADLLAYKRKSGLRVTVAHQYFKQFEDEYVLDAVKNLCKHKVMFNTPNPIDRKLMVQALGYGGEIPIELAQFANADLPKQSAVLKKGKVAPVRIRIPDVVTPEVESKAFREYIASLLTNAWNFTPLQVKNQMKRRLHEISQPPKEPDTRSAPERAETNSPSSSKTTPPTRRSVFTKS